MGGIKERLSGISNTAEWHHRFVRLTAVPVLGEAGLGGRHWLQIGTTAVTSREGAWICEKESVGSCRWPQNALRYKSQSYHVLLCVVAHGSPHGEPKPAHCESFPDENLDPGVLGIGWLSTELIEHNMTACRLQRWRERHIPAFCLFWMGFISTNPDANTLQTAINISRGFKLSVRVVLFLPGGVVSERAQRRSHRICVASLTTHRSGTPNPI